MRAIDKSSVRQALKLLKEAHGILEALCDDHQEWMDDRADENENWESTPTGERASEEQYDFEQWRDDLENLIDDIE